MNFISNTFTITATIWRSTDRVLLQYATILLLEGQLLFKKKSPRGGGDSDMKWTGMLVVSLRGVNFGFWSRLGCSGQNVIIFSRQGLV